MGSGVRLAKRPPVSFIVFWYVVVELSYNGYSDKKRDELCREIMSSLGE